jgi:hypothetical protein
MPGDRLDADRIFGALAVTARSLVAGRPQHGPHHRTLAVRLRPLLLRRCDDAACCGVADDGNCVSATVEQITTKKPP